MPFSSLPAEHLPARSCHWQRFPKKQSLREKIGLNYANEVLPPVALGRNGSGYGVYFFPPVSSNRVLNVYCGCRPKLLSVEGSSSLKSSRPARSDLASTAQEERTPKLKQEEYDDEHKLKDSADESKQTNEADEQEQHRDERQIQLDTDRSFVLYPDPVGELELVSLPVCTNSTGVGIEVKTDKENLQEELRKLLVRVFRKRPKLHYFQVRGHSTITTAHDSDCEYMCTGLPRHCNCLLPYSAI